MHVAAIVAALIPRKAVDILVNATQATVGIPTFQMAVEVYFITLGLIFGCIVALALWCNFLF